MEPHEDLPNEFDLMVQKFLEEYAQDNGQLCNANTVEPTRKRGFHKGGSHDFIAARNAKIALSGKMRRLALSEGTKPKVPGKATKKALTCPECGLKVFTI